MKKRSRVTAKTPKSSKQDAPPGYPDGDYVKCSCGRVITRTNKWQPVTCLACHERHPRSSSSCSELCVMGIQLKKEGT